MINVENLIKDLEALILVTIGSVFSNIGCGQNSWKYVYKIIQPNILKAVTLQILFYKFYPHSNLFSFFLWSTRANVGELIKTVLVFFAIFQI